MSREKTGWVVMLGCCVCVALGGSSECLAGRVPHRVALISDEQRETFIWSFVTFSSEIVKNYRLRLTTKKPAL